MQKIKYLPIVGLALVMGAGCVTAPGPTAVTPTAPTPTETISFVMGPGIPASSTVAEADKHTVASVDLNGDGKTDEISLITTQSPTEGITSTLKVHDASAQVPGTNSEGFFGIVDLNTADQQKEIAVTDLGPSNDYTTTFYAFDGQHLQNLGTVEGSWESMAFDGQGGFVTTVRAQVLDTWFHGEKWTLDANNVLTSGTETFFARNMPALTMKIPLSVKDRPTADAATLFTVNTGETVYITACDNALDSWCILKNSAGREGWLELTDFSKVVGTDMWANDIFDGLSNAD